MRKKARSPKARTCLAAISSFIEKLELTTAEPAAPLRRVGLLFVLGIAGSLLLQPLLAVVWELMFDTSAARDLSRHFGEQTLRGNPGIILAVAAIGPLIEEFIFRWGAFKLLRLVKLGILPTILITSVAFGAAHLHIAPVNAAFATLLGIALGWIYARTDDIWCPIALHAGINAGALVLMGVGVASGRL
jgi:membrane protease YdiL (CAAX protease family)